MLDILSVLWLERVVRLTMKSGIVSPCAQAKSELHSLAERGEFAGLEVCDPYRIPYTDKRILQESELLAGQNVMFC